MNKIMKSLRLGSLTKRWGRGAFHVWQRYYLLFQGRPLQSLFWLVFEPLLMLAAFGYGLGSYIPQVEGLSYLEFFFPTLLGLTAVLVPFYETAVAASFRLDNKVIYQIMLHSPLLPPDIARGEICWAATKGLLSTVIVWFIGWFFELTRLAKLPLNLLILIFVIFLSASCGLFVASRIRNISAALSTVFGVLMPLLLLSDTYFPVNRWHPIAAFLLQLSPLTQIMHLLRQSINGDLHFVDSIILAVLVLLTGFALKFALRHFADRLTQDQESQF